nr:hypothetical protein [Tanacetum cinerariifolium]
FYFDPEFTRIQHQESKLVVNLAEVQPGGARAHSFIEQVVAVAQTNQVARAQRATIAVVEEFLRAKPHFVGREELTEQFKRIVRIDYRDEAQAAAIKADLLKHGVRLSPTEPASERAFVASYRLDSGSIEQVDSIFRRIKASDGSRVVESDAATKQRWDKVLDNSINRENAGKSRQRER